MCHSRGQYSEQRQHSNGEEIVPAFLYSQITQILSRLYPQILFIVDRPNWAHDFKTRNLMRLLGSEYDIRLRYQSEVTEEDIHEATLIVLYYWLQFKALQPLTPALRRNRHKLLVGISFELRVRRRKTRARISGHSRLC